MSDFVRPSLCFVVTLAWFGCAKDAAVISTTPPPDAKLLDLDAQQRAQLCISSRWRVAASTRDAGFRHALCLLGGGFAAGFSPGADPQATCQLAYDTCLTREGWTERDAGADDSACSADRFSGCSATVKDFRDCQEMSIDRLVSVLGPLTCADVSSSSDAGVTGDNPLVPPQCQALSARCPSLAMQTSPPSECSVAITTTGAVDTDLKTDAGGCDFSSGRTFSGNDWLSLNVGLTEEAFDRVQVLVTAQDAGVSKRTAKLGLVLMNDNGANIWETQDGCTGDIETSACKVDDKQGVHYHVTNGRCVDALPAKDGKAGGLHVSTFSLSSSCVAW